MEPKGYHHFKKERDVEMKMPEGFVDGSKVKVRKRLIASIEGPQKVGKTHFSLTAPDPIMFFDMDIGSEGVINKFSNKKVWIGQYDYRMLSGPNPAVAILAMWEKMKADFIFACNSPDILTPVIDTATEMWELIRMARFGKLTQVMPHNYGPVNAEFRDLLRLSYSCGKDVIFIHKMKAEYVNDKRTGRLERAGFTDMGFLVQINLQAWRNQDGEFGMTILDCRQNPDLVGMELVGPMCNWSFLKDLVFS